MYDGVDERIVDGGSLGYDGRDGLGVRRQDVGVPTDRGRNELLALLTYISCSLPLFSDIPKGHRGSRISQNVPAAAHGRVNPAVHVCGCNFFFFHIRVLKKRQSCITTPQFTESQWMQMWKPGSSEDI